MSGRRPAGVSWALPKAWMLLKLLRRDCGVLSRDRPYTLTQSDARPTSNDASENLETSDDGVDVPSTHTEGELLATDHRRGMDSVSYSVSDPKSKNDSSGAWDLDW